MGKIHPDLDARLGRIHEKYLYAKAMGNYVQAADFLYGMNTTIPKNARITDMKQFKPKINHTRDKFNSSIQEQARLYCMKYEGAINSQVTDKVMVEIIKYGQQE